MVHSQKDIIPIDEPISVEPLLVLDGALNSVPVCVLKDDGCNKNILSTRLLKQNQQHFNPVKIKCIVQHSKEDFTDTSNEVILNGTLKTVSHTCATHWVVSDCGYDDIFGMPWHVKERPTVYYVEGKIDFKGVRLTARRHEKWNRMAPL